MYVIIVCNHNTRNSNIDIDIREETNNQFLILIVLKYKINKYEKENR